MIEMTSMFTLWAPYNSFIDRFTLISGFLLSCIFLHFFCVCIVNRNWIKTYGTFGEHNHTFNTVHDLKSIVFSKIMITFKFWLFSINIDFFRKYWVNLRCFTIGTVKSVSFSEIFSFSLDLDIEAFFIKLMSCYTTLNFIQ